MLELKDSIYTLIDKTSHWNLQDEILQQLQFIREWGGHCVVPIAKVAIYGGKSREVSYESGSFLWRSRHAT
jgi:hypothetical protein